MLGFNSSNATVSSTTINPANFVSGVTNPYFPLRPGTTLIYEGDTDEGHTLDRFRVTDHVVTILGVQCVEVIDLAYVDGDLVESTRDWFAQDSDGNVWYFGEATQQIENGQVIGTTGSWRAGVDGALPGIIMLADPEAGITYAQESAPGIAEDMATVLGDEVSANVGYAHFAHGVLETKEFTPLEPSLLEHKFYAPGVGLVLITEAGGREELTKIIFDGDSGDNVILGRVGADDLRGHGGDDALYGGRGADRLFGGAGDDLLTGGPGADVLVGGAGDDVMIGAGGADRFSFGGFSDGVQSVDVIADYHRSENDIINLGAGGASRVAFEQKVQGVWTLVLQGDGDFILLPGVIDRNHDNHIVDDLLFA